MESLSIIASQFPKPFPTFLTGNAFGSDFKPEPVAEMQHGFGDRRILETVAEPADERTIDFDPIDW